MSKLILRNSKNYFTEVFKEELTHVIPMNNYDDFSVQPTIAGSQLADDSSGGQDYLPLPLFFTNDLEKVKIMNSIDNENPLLFGVLKNRGIKKVVFGKYDGSYTVVVNSYLSRTDTEQPYDRAYLVSDLEITFKGE